MMGGKNYLLADGYDVACIGILEEQGVLSVIWAVGAGTVYLIG